MVAGSGWITARHVRDEETVVVIDINQQLIVRGTVSFPSLLHVACSTQCRAQRRRTATRARPAGAAAAARVELLQHAQHTGGRWNSQ
jgi:hypothetical protein